MLLKTRHLFFQYFFHKLESFNLATSTFRANTLSLLIAAAHMLGSTLRDTKNRPTSSAAWHCQRYRPSTMSLRIFEVDVILVVFLLHARYPQSVIDI